MVDERVVAESTPLATLLALAERPAGLCRGAEPTEIDECDDGSETNAKPSRGFYLLGWGSQPHPRSDSFWSRVGNPTPEKVDFWVGVGNPTPEKVDCWVGVGNPTPEKVDFWVGVGNPTPEKVDFWVGVIALT